MKALLTAAVITATMSLIGCGGFKYVDIVQNAPIALVSFSLDNSIVEDGKERSGGPGLLQKADEYFKHHQAAVNALWSDFSSQYRDFLLGAEAVDVATIAADEKYREMTKHVPKIMLGKDIAPGANELLAEGGLNYISSYSTSTLDSLTDHFKAKLLMLVSYQASYKMTTGVTIAGIGGGAAKMYLTASVHLYEKGKGLVLSKTFTESSDESFPIVGGVLLSDNYAKGLTSAQKKLFPQIKSNFELHQTKAKEAAAKS